ncbi:plasmid mobilization protein, partial [Pseudomonas amygdali]
VVVVGWYPRGGPMLKKRNKDRVVSFRLTEEQYAPFEKIMQQSGTKSSVFFRELLLNKTPVFKAASVDQERLVFIFNKSSNNLNQLAKRVHQAHHRGIVSEELFLKISNTLMSIRDLLLAGVDRADKS